MGSWIWWGLDGGVCREEIAVLVHHPELFQVEKGG